MNSHLAYSPWLDDWRKYADEAEMAPKARRAVTQAIQRKEAEWRKAHETSYRARFEHNRTTRNEQVVGAGKEMCAKLDQICADLASGRLTPQEASGVVRDVTGWHQRTMALHDTLVQHDADDLEALAAMTPDQYQRQFLGKFEPLLRNQPRLADLIEQIQRFGDIDNPPAPAQETPDSLRGVFGQ